MPFDHAAASAQAGRAWNGPDGEARLRRAFWLKAKRVARRIPFADDLVAAYYCAFDRATPLQVRTALVGALAYFVLPADIMPDILPLLGYGDDALVLATAIRMVAAHVRDEHREAARQALARGLDDAG
jgi:uncharacterized membrane protein YkvA (DUF1232 family)